MTGILFSLPRTVWAFAISAMIILAASGCRDPEPARLTEPTKLVTLTEAFRLGDEAAGDTILFGPIEDLEVDSRGRLYVTEQMQFRIRVFSSDGTPVGEFGSEGLGPGEFIWAPVLAIGAQDTVYAYDFQLGRLTVFSPHDYRYVDSIPVAESERGNSSARDIVGVTSQGFLMRYSMDYESVEDAYVQSALQISLVDRNGKIAVDSIASLPTREELVFTWDDGIIWHRLRYGRGPYFASGYSDLLYFAWNDAIQVTTVNPRGDVQRVITIPHDPVYVTQAEKEEEIADAGDEFEDGVREQMPSTKPAFESLLVDDAGRLWIELSRAEGASESDWLIVEDQDSERFRAQLPINGTILAIRNNRAYGTVRDPESGAAMIAVWDIGM